MSFLRSRVEEAARIVREGGVIIYPTDTVYGIGCNPFDEAAVQRVVNLKRRERKPHPVLAASLEDLGRVCHLSEKELYLGYILWPGPVTIVAEKRDDVPEIVTFGEPTVGVRIPADLTVLEIMRLSGTPLLGTSANISGMPPAASPDAIPDELKRGVDMVVDTGATRYGRPSTVIRLRGGDIEVVREGAVSLQELKARLSSTPYKILE
ncbi:Threonylcarbamoyl-AMP synthase [archaeon HR01]|nr:Threonylcarbamoyl-AMP synthase [archaeon HR01]